MVKRINLALQGAGAHGAFTWGVLDRLLQDEDIEIVAISGTSAGALNGAALKAGLVLGDRNAARDNLDWLWSQLGAIPDPRMAPWMSGFLSDPGSISKMIESSPFFAFVDTASRMFSPYSYGALYQNLLRRIVDRFRYDAVCAHKGPALFVCATNVRTGKIRVFENEIHTDAILASACLPTLFQAPEFEDPKTGKIEAFWDGGYTGNPALFPMFGTQFPDDIIIVNINPLERAEVPRTPQDIHNRINEISFNSSLLRELRAINFVDELLTEGALAQGAMKKGLVHMIADDYLMNTLSVATKTLPNPQILNALKEAGQTAADAFLNDHKAQLNVESTVDLAAMFGS